MWMQVLMAAGLRVIGKDFPATWKDTLEQANLRGFFESPLRRGIYYATNPHPTSGAWLPPGRPTRHAAVKVFIPGLVRSDVAYISQVIATVRPWREYTASIGRLLTLEAEGIKRLKGEVRAPVRMPPALEWWLENFMLLRDVATRKYPACFISYDRVLQDPTAAVDQVLGWLNVPGVDAVAAAAAVERGLCALKLGRRRAWSIRTPRFLMSSTSISTASAR